MPSNLKAETARRNGAKSRGPVTEEGKRTASRNAVKHGIHSTRVVLEHEDPTLYDRLLGAYLDEWQPATPTEEALVLDMVNSRWRLQRIQHLASAMVEQEMEDFKKDIGRKHRKMTAESICAQAHERNAPVGSLDNFERWEARLHRTFHRSLKTLRSLQTERLAAAVAEDATPEQPAQKSANKIRQNEPSGRQADPPQPLPSHEDPAASLLPAQPDRPPPGTPDGPGSPA